MPSATVLSQTPVLPTAATTWEAAWPTPAASQADLTLQLAAEGADVQLLLHASADAPRLKIQLKRDAAGLQLLATGWQWQEKSWTRLSTERLNYWPAERATADRAALAADGIAPRSWRDRAIRIRLAQSDDRLQAWIDGHLLVDIESRATELEAFAMRLHAAADDQVLDWQVHVGKASWRYQSVSLAPFPLEANRQPADLPEAIPFDTSASSHHLPLRSAHWVDGPRNPGSFYERYDSGAYFLGDPRMPMLQLPKADYLAAHLLVSAEADPAFSNVLTLRAGRYNQGIRGQVLRHDFSVEVPRSGGTEPAWQHVRLAMPTAFAQDLQGDVLDIELAKEVRLARRAPDPNRFRWRPQGLPSGVRIAAITFEKSPLQMRVGSHESGHLFLEPNQPVFWVDLQNISPQVQPFTLRATAKHLHGEVIHSQATGRVQAGSTHRALLPLPAALRGYYDLQIELLDADGQLLLERRTSFARLPDAPRPHRARSPFGVWDFCGSHLTPEDPDRTGPIYEKLGLRFGMFQYASQDRARYGVTRGNEFSVRSGTDPSQTLTLYQKLREQHPDLLPHLLLFHEDSISGPHVTRVPDLFHDRPAYVLDEKEKERFEKMMQIATEAARRMRAFDPSVRIMLGNGPLPLREEFYRHGFPAELFDAAGNEAGAFGRLPERQPPDIVANNASLWMDRQLLDHYGYGDKSVVQCYEVVYPGTNPGNLTYETQAAYYLRHLLHGLAWEIPELRIGSLTDMGNSYYFSNWGSSGFFRAWPEISPKPAAVALSTLTWLLDGATFERKLDLGSDSLYGLVFQLPDCHRLVALWTIRGERPVTLALQGTQTAEWIDSQGNLTPLATEEGRLALMLTGSPAFLRLQGDVGEASPGKPRYHNAPADRDGVQLLTPLASLAGWRIAEDRNPLLKTYNPMEPRRPGRFTFEPVDAIDGRPTAIRVTPQPIPHGKPTMPMVVELVHETGLELAGQPTELGLYVHGNSGWGRILYELTDAQGQRWVSIGARGQAGNRWLADWLPPEMLADYDPSQMADWNTNDTFGFSHINFDGWRYLAVPLPGQYPGAGHPWPANSQWYSDGDGKVVYPLTLRKIIVQLNEKVLHVKDYQPPRRPEIYLSELTARDTGPLGHKHTSGSYNHHVQVDGLR